MQSLRGVTIVSVALTLPVVVLVVACHRSNTSDLTAEQWSDLINKSLPTGSSQENVEKFLDQHRIEHSYIAKSNFPDETNSVVALVRSNDSGMVKKSGIQLKFKLDANQRLVSFQCREIFTGP